MSSPDAQRPPAGESEGRADRPGREIDTHSNDRVRRHDVCADVHSELALRVLWLRQELAEIAARPDAVEAGR